MTEVTLSLPDELAQRAEKAGLLSDRAIRALLEDAMRRDAGRRLLEVAERLHASGIAPMSDEEIVAHPGQGSARRAPRAPSQGWRCGSFLIPMSWCQG